MAMLQNAIKWHKWLGWTGGIGLLLFALSGITHPLMTWTGPQAASFFPPQAVIATEAAARIPLILEKAGITAALMVKMVPAASGALLQVTEHNDQPRRYFDLSSSEELPGYDKQHAVWLARYYTGLKDTPIDSVAFQNKFTDAYPWVNRLLPIYKVTFATDDNLTAFIYTELGALGSLTNDWKTALQSIFSFVHTWNWLGDVEYARVILMMVFLLSLWAMAATGVAMVFLMKNRKMDKKRKMHRMAAYVIWVPLLLFSTSGTYHLLQRAYGDNHHGLQLTQPFSVAPQRFQGGIQWLDPYRKVKLNGMSIVEGPKGDLLYRLSLPQGGHGQNVEKQTRFDGVPIEKPALYFSASSGEESGITDRDMAVYYAGKQLGFDHSLITNTKRVTHFGPDYDFRNKRLPVWRVDYATELGDMLFIDPASGMLVDRLVDAERFEGYSFSFLHKWNFITPLIGRTARDVLMVLVLSIAIASTILGYIMLLSRRKRKRGL